MAGPAGDLLGQTASKVHSYAENSKSNEPGVKLSGLAGTPCHSSGSQKSEAERPEQEIRGHMGKGGQEPGKMGRDLLLKQVRNLGHQTPHFMISYHSTSFSLSAPILLGLQEIHS